MASSACVGTGVASTTASSSSSSSRSSSSPVVRAAGNARSSCARACLGGVAQPRELAAGDRGEVAREVRAPVAEADDADAHGSLLLAHLTAAGGWLIASQCPARRGGERLASRRPARRSGKRPAGGDGELAAGGGVVGVDERLDQHAVGGGEQQRGEVSGFAGLERAFTASRRSSRRRGRAVCGSARRAARAAAVSARCARAPR